MAKKVSMDSIAKKLGISKNTVSLALRGMPGISDQTRKLVLDTARQFGYEYKKVPKNGGNRETASRNICLILSKSTRDSVGFFSYIQFGIEDEAKKNNLNIFLYYYDENDESFETPICVREGMISGIITLGRISEKTINSIIKYNLPLVMADHYFDDINIDCILTDNHSGGYTATEHLIKSGHRDIGFVGNIYASISFYDRYQGYLKALNSFGLPVNASYSLINKSLEELAARDLTLAVQELKSLPKLPTAIFCCNDAEAIATYKALSIMGVAIPKDISVVGFDDIEFARNISPELTTMRVEKELMGKKAVQRLIEKIEDPADLQEKVLISASLVERQSVKDLES